MRSAVPCLHPPNDDKLVLHLTWSHARAHLTHTSADTAATVNSSTAYSSSPSASSLMKAAVPTSPPFSPAASVAIDIPSTSHLLHPSSPTSPSHDHSAASHHLTAASLERYWPLIAVTIASIYLITLVPFIAPGLFLIQFSLLRYIRHRNDKVDSLTAKYGRPHYGGGGRWMRGGERVSRRSLRVPVMDVIVEETEAAVVEEEQPSKDKLLVAAKHISLLHAHRPPPLVIPNIDTGTVTRPTPLPTSSSSHTTIHTSTPIPSAASTALPAVFPLTHSSTGWHEASQELNQLLSSGLQLLQVERQLSTDNLMAATATLLLPPLIQPLTSAHLTPTSACSSSSSSPFSRRASSVASTASTDVEESSTTHSSYYHSHSPYMSDEVTPTAQRPELTKKRFSFDSCHTHSELSASVVESGLVRRMEELMCNV